MGGPTSPANVLVIGGSGLLGNAVARVLSRSANLRVTCTVRGPATSARLRAAGPIEVIESVDALRLEDLESAFARARPAVVVNCVGATKHVDTGNEASAAYLANAVLPHVLSTLCATHGSRLVHVSTDCVFTGRKGMYVESDRPDAEDVYGQSKAAGEVRYRHALTIRTSIIGHEIDTDRSLIEWFMRQSSCRGFRRAIFSGFPTVTLARIIRDVVIPDPSLHGLYHVAAPPIDKYDLLTKVADAYALPVTVTPDDGFVIDRSLDGSRFAAATGFVSPGWDELVREMHSDWESSPSLFRGFGGAAR
jgi:dTDP-4-dehydrorhamnose reductase